ncbi:hypothetical protein ACTXNM_10910 [Psychrobacter celer]|uniref:hypothetical protein n=1 Tax=Psychrobacter celer TaxID=306572 RepID=UPI003FD3CED1
MFRLTAKEESLEFEGFTFKYIFKNRKYDTNHLIIVLNGFGRGTDFHYDFEKALISNRAYVLWIKDDFYDNNRASYYMDPPTLKGNKLESAMIKFIDSALNFLDLSRDNCTLLGCSKGGSAVMYYGIKYKFNNILVSAPTLLIGSSVAGIIPKAKPKRPAKFMLGEDLDLKNVKELDSRIIDVITQDTHFDRNIYLLGSEADPKYSGQIKPFLGLFHKYHNFNFIESQSVLVRNHKDVTYYNAPLILSILNCFAFNLLPSFNNSIIQGDSPNKKAEFDSNPVLKVQKIHFDEKGFLFPEGVFFLRGVPFIDFKDFKYILKFKSKENTYEIFLAKRTDQLTTKMYYKDAFVNYDKANFCTFNHKGIDLSHIEPDVYQVFIELKLVKLGRSCEIPFYMHSSMNTESIGKSITQKFYSENNRAFYSKSAAKNKSLISIISSLNS